MSARVLTPILFFGLVFTIAALVGRRDGGTPEHLSGTEPAPVSGAPGPATASARPRPESGVTAPRRREVADPSQTTAPRDASDFSLRGRVFDADGQLRPGATVGVLAIEAGEPTDPQVVLASEADPRGHFVLDLPAPLRHRDVALVARYPGQRPATLLLTTNDEAATREFDLTLERGYSIEGRVVANEGSAQAHLDVDIRFGTPGVFGIGSEAFWIGGRLEEKHASTRSDPVSGAFSITGLGPYEHRLQTGSDANSLISQLQQVTAPARIEIDLTPAIVEVVASDGGRPLASWFAKVALHGRTMERVSSGQPCRFALPEHTDFTLTAHHTESRTVQRSLQAPARGQLLRVAFDLPRIERPSLQLTVVGSSGAEVDRLRLWMEQRDAANVEQASANLAEPDDTILPNDHFETDLERKPGSDVFVVDRLQLDPGHYTIAILPTDGEGAGHYLQTTEDTLDVPTRGLIRHSMSIRHGGRFEVSLHTDDGSRAQASFQLVDGDGDVHLRGIAIAMTATESAASPFSPMDGPWNGNPWTITLPAITDMDVRMGFESAWSNSEFGHVVMRRVKNPPRPEVVAPGSYRLRLEATGWEPYETTVNIVSGQTTRHDVKLTKRAIK